VIIRTLQKRECCYLRLSFFCPGYRQERGINVIFARTEDLCFSTTSEKFTSIVDASFKARFKIYLQLRFKVISQNMGHQLLSSYAECRELRKTKHLGFCRKLRTFFIIQFKWPEMPDYNISFVWSLPITYVRMEKNTQNSYECVVRYTVYSRLFAVFCRTNNAQDQMQLTHNPRYRLTQNIKGVLV